MGRPRLINEGDIFKNISGLEYKVVEYLGNKQYVVEFLDTGNTVKANNGNVKAGKVKDNMSVTVGSSGLRGNPRTYIRKEYDAWKNMFYRCENDPIYADVTICDRWLILENFLEDIQKLENYNQWYSNETSRGWALDKDIKYKGNRVYCPSACMFVTTEENSREANSTVSNNKTRTYKATNKDLDLKLEFCNQRKFANTYGLNYKNVSRAIKQGGTTKGWAFKTIEE